MGGDQLNNTANLAHLPRKWAKFTGLGFNLRWFFFYPKFFDIETKKCKDIQEGKSYEPIEASVHHIDFDEAIETGIILLLDQVVHVNLFQKHLFWIS